jgi:hypothetical protein
MKNLTIIALLAALAHVVWTHEQPAVRHAADHAAKRAERVATAARKAW